TSPLYPEYDDVVGVPSVVQELVLSVGMDPIDDIAVLSFLRSNRHIAASCPSFDPYLDQASTRYTGALLSAAIDLYGRSPVMTIPGLASGRRIVLTYVNRGSAPVRQYCEALIATAETRPDLGLL